MQAQAVDKAETQHGPPYTALYMARTERRVASAWPSRESRRESPSIGLEVKLCCLGPKEP